MYNHPLLFAALLFASMSYAAPTSNDPPGTADRSRTIYYEQLGQIIPDWKKINQDANFLKWLDLKPIPGATSRRQQLLASYSAADATASARIFERWTVETDQPMPFMRREDLLRVGAATFDDACRSCHTLADATRLAASYSLRIQKTLSKGTVPPISVSLFFTEPPDNKHRFPGRGSFEVAGLVTLLTESAFGSSLEPMQAGAIEAQILYSHMAGQATRLDQPAGSTMDVVAARPATRTRLSNDAYHFEMVLLPGWIAIPDAEVEKRRADLLTAGSRDRFVVATAFQRGFKGEWFAGPYGFVGAVTTGMTSLPTVAQFDRFVQAIVQAPGDKQLASATSSTFQSDSVPEARGLVAALSIGDVRIDAQARRFSYVVNTQRATGESVKMYVSDTFLSTGQLLQLNYFPGDQNPKNSAADFFSLSQTLRELKHE